MPQDQVFRAGDFPIHVTEVTGTTTYTGKGWTRLPYFSFVKIEVEFTNIKLNTDMSLVDGVVKAVYDPNWSNILNVNALINIAKDLVDVVADVVQQLLNALNAYTGTKQDQTKIKDLHAQIDTITTNLLASSYITTEQKNQLVQAAQNNKDCWQKLEQGVPCASKPANPTPTKSGPNASNYTPSDNEFDCCTTPLSENANLIAAVAQAQTEAQNCKMPEPARGCPDGTLENPFNDGNWKSILELLNQLKTAINLKKPFTYKKSLTLDTGSQISIGQTCFDPIYYDFTAMTETAKTINTITYKIETTTSFGGASYTTINFDGQLWIKIPQTASSKAKIDYLEKWLLCGGTATSGNTVDTATKPPIFPVTGAQLHDIFAGTSASRCEEVAKLINKYSNKFEINTPLKMAHFLGQIGVETGGLKSLKEIPCYREGSIRANFGYSYYCDLFVGFECVDLDKCATNTQKVKCNPGIPNTSEEIKNKYICTPSLFDYVYSCSARLKGGRYDLGNGPPSSNDGSTFLGRGFIQLTGKYNYKELSDKWNDDPENIINKKYFHKQINDGGHIDELETNLDVAMKASMYYWELNECNKFAERDDTGGVTEQVKGNKSIIEIENRGKIKDKALIAFKN